MALLGGTREIEHAGNSQKIPDLMHFHSATPSLAWCRIRPVHSMARHS